MLTIRLTRVGKKKDASFRVIIVDSKRKVKAGNYLEMVGSYDPRTDKVVLEADRVKHWLSVGATTSDTVHNLLVSQKIIDAKKRNVLPRKSPPKKDEPAAAAPVAPSAPAETPVEEVKKDVPGEASVKSDNAVAAEAPADTIAE